MSNPRKGKENIVFVRKGDHKVALDKDLYTSVNSFCKLLV